MTWQASLYLILLLISSITSALVSFYAWRLRHSRGGMLFFLYNTIFTVWGIYYITSLFVNHLDLAIFLELVFDQALIFFSPSLIFMFILEFTRREHWLTRRNVFLLMIPPLLSAAIIVTNEWHHGLFSGYERTEKYGLNLLTPEPQPAYESFLTFNYLFCPVRVDSAGAGNLSRTRHLSLANRAPVRESAGAAAGGLCDRIGA